MRAKIIGLALPLISFSAMADQLVIGDTLEKEKIPSYVCSINTISKDNFGQCTGSLIDKKYVVTARHCFESENDMTLVTCGEEVAIPVKITLGKDQVQDVAILELSSDMKVTPVEIMTEDEQQEIANSKTTNCEVYGYGTNNQDELGELNGVKVDQLVQNVDQMVNFVSYEIIQPLFMKMLSLEADLVDVHQAFVDYNLSLISIDELNLIIAEHSEKYLEFDKKFNLIADQMINPFVEGERVNFYYEVTSKASEKTKHTSAFLPGDSGGPLVCEINSQMKLMGINVLVLDADVTNNSKTAEGQEIEYKVFEKGLSLPIQNDILDLILQAKK